MESANIASFTGRFQTMFEADDPAASRKEHESGRVDAVRRQFEALGRGDMQAFLDSLHPEVELEIAAPPELNWLPSARGADEFRRVVEHNFAQVADQDTRLLAIVAQGDVVVVTGRETGRIRSGDRPYDLYFTYMFTFRDGKEWRILEIAAAAGNTPRR